MSKTDELRDLRPWRADRRRRAVAISGAVRWFLGCGARMLQQFDAQLADAWEPFLVDDVELPSEV